MLIIKAAIKKVYGSPKLQTAWDKNQAIIRINVCLSTRAGGFADLSTFVPFLETLLPTHLFPDLFFDFYRETRLIHKKTANHLFQLFIFKFGIKFV